MKTKTVTVVARETFPYADVIRRPGDAFQAPAEDARVLLLVGRVVRPHQVAVAEGEEAQAPEAPVAPRGRSRRKDIVPEL